MSKSAETLRVVIPLTFRKKNGRPKILPPEDVMPFPERRQDPHILRAIGRSWGWRRKIEAGTAPTIRDIAEIEKISASLVARYLRLAYLAPEVIAALLVERRVPAVRVLDLALQPEMDRPQNLPGRIGVRRSKSGLVKNREKSRTDAEIRRMTEVRSVNRTRQSPV